MAAQSIYPDGQRLHRCPILIHEALAGGLLPKRLSLISFFFSAERLARYHALPHDGVIVRADLAEGSV